MLKLCRSGCRSQNQAGLQAGNGVREPVLNPAWFVMLMVLFLLWPKKSLWAQTDDNLSYTTYYFNDSGNNSVITTSFSLAKNIIAGTALLLDIELDKVKLPPVDGATGASRPARSQNETFEKNRGQVILGLEQRLIANTSVAFNVYRSQELDYISNALILSARKEMFQSNTSLTVKAQYNSDQVGKQQEDGSIYNRDKSTVTASLGLSQILSKHTVFDLVYDFMKMEGFLSDPYRTVKVFDINNAFKILDENHPKEKIRHAGTGRVKSYLPSVNASLIGSYRYYFDDWGVRSHTGEARMNMYVLKNWIMGFNYRYYIQTEANFYANKYNLTNNTDLQLRTADYKLYAFQSNTYGITLKMLLRNWAKDNSDLEFLNKSAFEVMYLRYTNDLDFSANILQATLTFAI